MSTPTEPAVLPRQKDRPRAAWQSGHCGRSTLSEKQSRISATDLRAHFDYRDDGSLIRRKAMPGHPAGSVAGSLANDGYVRIEIGRASFPRSHLVWLYFTGAWPEVIDHVNGVRSDDRFINLRNVTVDENNRNMRRPKTNKSGAIGVTMTKSTGKWRASLRVNGKNIHLGYFDNIQDAIEARKAADTCFGFHPNHGRSE